MIRCARGPPGEPARRDHQCAALDSTEVHERLGAHSNCEQSQHLCDLIRFQIPLNPAPGVKFPGVGTYGSQLCMPLPDVEAFNNPNLKTS